MKNHILIFVTAILTLTACKKSFLELSDPTKIANKDLFSSQANVTAAVTGVYSQLQPIYNNDYFVFGELASDNAYEGVSANGRYLFNTFNVESNNPNLQSMWTDTYRCISRANTVLVRAVDVKMDETLKARYLAEMKFIRALNYFNLVRIWGEVPLVTADLSDDYQSAYNYGKAPVTEVYKQIITDLKDAETTLPASYPSADIGRPTSSSAKALLGKVYLTQKNYPLAEAKLGELIPGTPQASNLATLQGLVTTGYSDLFSTTNETNKEILFAVRYLSGGLGVGSTFAGLFIPGYSGTDIIKAGLAGGSGVLQRKDLYDAYSSDDKRAAVAKAYFSKSGQSDYHTKKYILNGAPFARNDGDNDWIVLRYADVLLMYAEALNEQHKTTSAYSYVNQIRARAGLGEVGSPMEEELRLILEKERRLEFSFEGQRWFDLVRTGRLLPVMNAFYIKYAAITSTNTSPNNGLFTNTGGSTAQLSLKNMVFPIPLAETQYNPKLLQNIGYQ